MLNDFHFIRPYWFFALIPLAIILWRLSYVLQRADNWQNICDKHLLPHLLVNPSKKSNVFPLFCLAWAWLLAITALAGPTWSRLPQPVFQSLNSRVIALDLSTSMYATDILPNRLERAKYKIMDMLKQFKDGQTGMLAFTSEPFVVSPLTQDSNTIAALVPELNPKIMPVEGSDIAAALQKSADLFKQAGIKTGRMYLLTNNPANNTDIATAKKLAHEGYQISVLGIGSMQGAPVPNPQGGFATDEQGKTLVAQLDTSSLEKLAEAGAGTYVAFTNTNKDLDELLKPSLKESFSNNVKMTSTVADVWREQGQWLILLIIPVALLAFRRGWMNEVAR